MVCPRKLQQSLAPSYVRAIFTNLSAVFNAVVDDGLIASNPCRASSVKPPPLAKRKVEPWSVEQVGAVIDELPERYRTIGVVAAGCGLRQGEAFGLRVRDVDFLRRQVHVEQQVKIVAAKVTIGSPKGGKTRTVPLPDTVAAELAEHLRRHPAEGDDLVFASREHKPLDRNHFNPYVWKKALEAAGVEPSRHNGMHALRHFYAVTDEQHGRQASAEILLAARSLTDHEIRKLASATESETGFLGRKQEWWQSMEAATNAAEKAGRRASVDRAGDDALFAILDAAAARAQERGRDVNALRTELLVRSTSPSDVAVRRLRRLAGRALGWRIASKVSMASVGVGAAMAAVLTWDLASDVGPYSFGDREAMARPWVAVRPLPGGSRRS